MNKAYNHGSQGDLLNVDKIEKPASNAPDGTGELIREAARDGNIESLRALLDKWRHDPVVNEGDTIGTTALHTAASNGHKDCVTLLLEAGADVTLKNGYGQTPFSKAKTEEIAEMVRPPEASPPSMCGVM